MVTSEREMVRKLDVEEEKPEKAQIVDRSTSLQPTYEDTIVPDPDDWELDD
jgi:transcriptional regulator of NAD metabolism